MPNSSIRFDQLEQVGDGQHFLWSHFGPFHGKRGLDSETEINQFHPLSIQTERNAITIQQQPDSNNYSNNNDNINNKVNVSRLISTDSNRAERKCVW